MVDTLIKVVLALVVVGFVAYPLLKEQGDDEESLDLPEDLEDLYRRKESAYSALKELEFDYRTGKLSEGDFRELEARYRAEALEILTAIDEAEQSRVAPVRRKGNAQAPRRRAPEPEAPAAADLAAGECAACGRANLEDARFCAGCGEALEVVSEALDAVAEEEASDESLCDECGSPVSPDHRFCGSCGAEVEA